LMKKYSVENTLSIPFFLPAIGDKILGSGIFHTDEPESQKFPLLFIKLALPIHCRSHGKKTPFTFVIAELIGIV